MNICDLLAKWSLRVALSAVLLAVAIHGAAADGKPKIAFLLKTMQEQRYQTDRRDFIAAAEKLGADVQFDSAGNDEERQLEQFDAALEAGANVIVLQPVDTGTAGAMVAKANARGVRVVGYDSMIANGPLDVMVMQDSWAVGALQADALVEWLQKKNGKVAGTIVLIMGQPGDSNAQAMSSGVYDMLAKNPGVKLLAQRSHADWSPDAARATAETLLLKYPAKSTPSSATIADWRLGSFKPCNRKDWPMRARFSSPAPTQTSATLGWSQKASRTWKSGKKSNPSLTKPRRLQCF